MVDKRSASKVVDYREYSVGISFYHIKRVATDMFYCPAHKKPYDKKLDHNYYKLIPAQEVRVNEDGTVYKEKK
jgi:hypothetical protein